MKVTVVGAGLAGVVAALSAKRAGADVTVLGTRPGATALWSGVAELFGPAYDQVGHHHPTGHPTIIAPGRPPIEDRRARFDRLLRRRTYHPYARLALGLEEVGGAMADAARLLGVEMAWADSASYVANLQGTARLADGALPAIWRGRLEADRTYAVVGFEHFPAFSPESASGLLRDQGLRADPVWVGHQATGPTNSPAQAAARLEAMDDEALARLGESVAQRVGRRTALLPPILGRTPDAHQRLWSRLTEGSPRPAMAELASVHKSLHGFRFHLELLAALTRAEIACRSDLVVGATGRARRLDTLELSDGQKLETDALILATGRTSSGGHRRGRPYTEALLGLPLYLEGSPLDSMQHPPELTSPRLLEDHPLYTVGVGVTPRLQPLGERARPAWDNVHATGLVIGGTDFTRDGTAFGVSLVTGLLAGRWAAGGEA